MRVFLAAVSSGGMNTAMRKQTIARSPPKYLLESFASGEKHCRYVLDIVRRENFLLDSGAFSFLNGKDIDKAGMEEYLNRYISFICKEDIPFFFEMDVDKIFGLEQVEIWRRQLEKAVGRQSIPVWHKSRGVAYWEEMCRKYSYVAIGGLAIKDISTKEYPLIKRLTNYADSKGVRVHGLGYTRIQGLENTGFYSVDSTSWLSGAIRGKQRYDFIKGQFNHKVLETEGRKINMSYLCAHNFMEWVKFQRFLDWKGDVR